MAEVERVLLISGEYPPMEGGVADFTHLLGEALADRGAEVHVLTSAAAQQPAIESRVCCHPLLHSWGWGSLQIALRAILREIRPHVINIQYQTAAYGMHPAINLLPGICSLLRLWRLPIVVTFHDLLVPYLFPKAGRLRWWANLALARSCQAAIVTNAEDRARLAQHGGVKRLELIPIGSNIACTLPAGYDRVRWREGLGLPATRLVLCYFGFLNASKGGEELIAALDRLCASGYDCGLLMIGGAIGASDPTNRAYLERVQRAIQQRGLTERVIWTGYLAPPDVSASFCAADVCVLPYRDGASFRRGSFMAALAHGLPIVSMQPAVGLPELVHGQNILLVPRGDAKALAAAIARLADDVDLRQRLGRGALALSHAFEWQGIASRTLEVYRAVTV